MTSVYEVILEEFSEELNAMRVLIDAFDSPGKSSRVRLASANSTVLLLAATYEEFVRQMAAEYAKMVVKQATRLSDVPSILVETAWRRTLEDAAKVRIEQSIGFSMDDQLKEARERVRAVADFVEGDITQDIYTSLVQNDNNMRPREMNSMFRRSGLSNVCKRISSHNDMLDYFGEQDAEVVHGHLIARLEGFFALRNQVAHALSPGSTVSPDTIRGEIKLLEVTGRSLEWLLDGERQAVQRRHP